MQGPWDEQNDALSLRGAPALPMPVQISDKESLAPFFEFLSRDDNEEPWIGARTNGLDVPEYDQETHYGVDVGLWEKSTLYGDGRMDLCKM